jgi:hypothetical protein
MGLNHQEEWWLGSPLGFSLQRTTMDVTSEILLDGPANPDCDRPL